MKKSDEITYEKEKFFRWYTLLNVWLYVKNSITTNFESYFIHHNFKRIAIYGCGELGCRLFEELQHTNIEVAYMIDKNAANIRYKCEVISVQDFAERKSQIDAVIVSPIQSFEIIKKGLMQFGDTEIISLEEVIDYYAY